MKSIFEFKNYRKYLEWAFEQRASNGFGEAKKLAEYLRIHPTFVSQVLKGAKSLSAEQSLGVTKYLNLNNLETDYFLLLVQIDRAGTSDLKKHLQAKLIEIESKANQLVNRVKHDARLTSEQQATFYSDWLYSACRLSTLLPNMQTLDQLSAYLRVSKVRLKDVTDFLVDAGMLKLEGGRFEIGPLATHLDGRSPWIKSHHTNWRQKALERLSFPDEASLHYSAPMTLSLEDMKKVKEILIKSINDVDEVLEPSPSETLVCLNIDWFKINSEDS